MTRSPRREHITPVLKQLHWLKVRERIRYKILILTHKTFCANAPPYLCSLVVKRESTVSTRLSQDGYLLCKPPISRDCSNTFFERSFLYAAPHEWNSSERGVRVSEFNALLFNVILVLIKLTMFLMFMFSRLSNILYHNLCIDNDNDIE